MTSKDLSGRNAPDLLIALGGHSLSSADHGKREYSWDFHDASIREKMSDSNGKPINLSRWVVSRTQGKT